MDRTQQHSNVFRPVVTRLLPSVTIAVAAFLAAACNGSGPSAAPQRRTVADSAEHVMYNGRMNVVSNGVRRGEASGNAVYSFDAATRFNFRPLRMQLVTPLGRPLAVVTASDGFYSLSRPIIETGGVVTITSDTSGRRITGRAVRYDPTANEIASDSAFTATAGTRKLTGVGFTADPGLFTIRCRQGCRGSLGSGR